MANYRPGRTRRARPFPLPQCLSAPPLPPLPSWIVLDDLVAVGDPPLNLQQEWALVECAKRTAYGCGEHGQEVLDGLTLYVRLVKPRSVTSALYIDASDDALCSIRAQFRDALPSVHMPTDGKLRAHGAIYTADSKHMVMVIQFHLQYLNDLIYYVLYDAFDRSLTMVPCPPEPRLCPANCTVRPLTLPRDGGAGGYDMVVMSQMLVPPLFEGTDHSRVNVIYMWTPSAAMGTGTRDDVWEVKGWPQRVPQPFCVESMFSSQGKLFFADLSQGLLCCNLCALTGNTVIMDFIPLPAEVPSALRWDSNTLEDFGPMDRTRTIGCVGGSIRFVCIDHSAGSYADVNVTSWVLDLATRQWMKDQGFSALQLWKKLSFRRKGLPEMPPKCPVLMPDGSVSFLFPRLCKREEDPNEDYVCNLDVTSMAFRWLAPLDSCSYTAPIFVPGSFFTSVTPPNQIALRMGIFM